MPVASFTRTMSASAIDPPDESSTIPLIVPVGDCAGHDRKQGNTRAKTRSAMRNRNESLPMSEGLLFTRKVYANGLLFVPGSLLSGIQDGAAGYLGSITDGWDSREGKRREVASHLGGDCRHSAQR